MTAKKKTPPATTRELWLTVALAIAEDGLPEPKRFGFNLSGDGPGIVSLNLTSHVDARRWTEWLGLQIDDRPPITHPDLPITMTGHYGSRSGWTWHIDGREPVSLPSAPESDLAAQVVAAIQADAQWEAPPVDCDCPVRPAPEMRGDPRDTLIEHADERMTQADEVEQQQAGGAA
jgi:hypothetical protein